MTFSKSCNDRMMFSSCKHEQKKDTMTSEIKSEKERTKPQLDSKVYSFKPEFVYFIVTAVLTLHHKRALHSFTLSMSTLDHLHCKYTTFVYYKWMLLLSVQ